MSIEIYHHNDADIALTIYNLPTDDGLLEDGLKLIFTVKETELDLNDDQAIFPQKTSDDPTEISISNDVPGTRTTPGIAHVYIKPEDTVNLPQIDKKYICDLALVDGSGREYTCGKVDFWVKSNVTSCQSV